MTTREKLLSAGQVLICVAMLSGNMWAQQAISSLDRGTANDMMEVVANDIRKNYYDPKFHGVDWDTRVAATKLQINKSTSMDMAFSYIAALVDTLNDSHTMFYPPARNLESNFGFDYQMIGADRCYVTRVRPGSDAEAKGMKPGNEIITINGYLPDRENVWKMGYIFNVLRPQDFLRVRVQLPSDGSSREIQVKAKVVPHKNTISLSWSWGRYIDAQNHSMRARSTEFGDELMILKLPYFEFTNSEIGNMIGRARKHQTLILDLRGNPGGATETLTNFVGALFEKQVKIADRVTRKETKPWVAKPQHIVFTGKLIVLVDSDSASASELLARVVQLEKRGTVIGDRTSGSVMEAKYHRNQMGGDFIMFYGESITDANLIMTDGKSLEHVGVTPDESIVPTAQDLANNQDPVLSHAAEMAGVKLTPEAAAKIFPYEWPSE